MPVRLVVLGISWKKEKYRQHVKQEVSSQNHTPEEADQTTPLSTRHCCTSPNTQVSADNKSPPSSSFICKGGIVIDLLREFNCTEVFHATQVKEVSSRLASNQEGYRWQAEALMAIQEASEQYLTRLFEDAYVNFTSSPPLT